MGKPFRSKMKKRMNIRFIIKRKKKINFDPIQLNQTRGKKKKKINFPFNLIKPGEKRRQNNVK